MEYEYMALSSEDGAYAGQCRAAVRNKELADKGWKNWRMIPWYESGIVSICVVRRELKPKDGPRMWTKAEIKEIAGSVYIGFDMEKARDCRPVLNERVKQADDGVKPQAGECLAEPRNEWPCERVADLKENFQVVANITEAAQTRVAELQTAIDEVVCVANQGGEYKAVLTLQVVRRLLNPLATKKEESNG